MFLQIMDFQWPKLQKKKIHLQYLLKKKGVVAQNTVLKNKNK
jgi:hypothetical protein